MGKNGKTPNDAEEDETDEDADHGGGALDAKLRRLGEEILREPTPEHLLRILREIDEEKTDQATEDVPDDPKAKPKKTKD